MHERATAILHIERLRSQRQLSLPLQLHLMFLGGAFYLDVPELGPLIDLAIPLRVLSHGISIPGNGCCPESPARGIIINGGAL